MAAGRRGSGRRRRGGGGQEADDERWLLTYADMITLLMALFMVLFSISSVNTSKYEALQRSLQDAFSGKVLEGGRAVMETGSTDTERDVPDSSAVVPVTAPQQAKGPDAGDESFERLKRRVEAYAASHGLRDQVQAEISRRGLVVRLLTDDVLFESGAATLKPDSEPLLIALGELLRTEVQRPTVVEGHTDNVPIHSGVYPSNWELSTARATSVLRFLLSHGAPPWRLSAAGYANTRPIATNDSDRGRHRNRRVEIVVLRRGQNDPGGPA